MNKLKHIKDLIFKYKYRYLVGILCLIAVDTLQLVLPKILGTLTDLLKDGLLNYSILYKYSLAVIALSVGIAIFRFLWRYLVFGTARFIETELRDRFYAHLQKLPVNYFNNTKTGDLMAHVTNDISNIRMCFGQGIAMATDSILIPLAALVMMFYTAGYKLTAASFAPLIILAVVMIILTKYMHNRIQKLHEAFSKLTECARENFSGIRVIKSFSQEKKEILKFKKVNEHNKEMNLSVMRLMRMLFPLIMTISSFSFVITLWYGGILVIRNEISLGDFIAFNSYLGMLIWPTAALGWVTSLYQRGIVSLERVNKILDEKPEIQQIISSINEIRGKIQFNNLSFSYPGSKYPTLKNIDITIQEGKTLAVVGPTGSGKSTLMNLIVKLFNVNDEMLLIDNTDINTIPVSLLRSSIGYVPQDTFLFSSTIRDNIDFYQRTDDDSIKKAAAIAKVYDNIMEFPAKFETVLGERGVTLSGGQKQRVAIARAVVRKPAILLLDDCLSAVDTHTEEEILRELKDVMKDRTSIIISHRISTIKDADEIIVLADGEIAERGTHNSLLENKGFYYDLYQKQLLKEQIEEEE